MTVLRHLIVRLVAVALMLAPPLMTGPALAVSVEDLSGEWTILIPDAFPGMVFSWKVAQDGTYQEDARRQFSGRRTQPTMSGKWSVEDRHLVMTQDSQGFVFEGDVAGKFYSGSLFLKGVPVSHFCAVKGSESPGTCDRTSA